MIGRGLLLAWTCGVATAVVAAATNQPYLENLPIGHPAIQYLESRPNDPVAQLATQVERGNVKLSFRRDGTGYLASVLEHLHVNTDSQALVFSKTSLQAVRVSPRRPRAIYFSDDVSVGFVRGGDVLELAALDPRQGIIFYTLNNQRPTQPAFRRGDTCLHCHQGPATGGVPGIFVSSVYPSPSGMPDRAGAIVTDHRTPFRDRWGGWYVNGRHGESPHRGNAVAPNPAAPQVLDSEWRTSLADLAGHVDTRGYLSSVSDIVALLTFEHQTQMTNLLTRLGWEARIAQHDLMTEEPGAGQQSTVEELIAYMLFVDEPVLNAPVHGVTSFSRSFQERGPRDQWGRSLRDFDLRQRLFRYPLSYMLYDTAFDALPDGVRAQVYRRLFEVLTGKDRGRRFSRLTENDRRSILEIVNGTKLNLPEYWRAASATPSPPAQRAHAVLQGRQ